MADGFLNISHNFAGESQFIVCEWVKSTAQGTPVLGHVTGTGLGAQNDTDQTQVFYPSPHVNEQLHVDNLPEVWHIVRFWRSSDGIAKDVLLLELAGNARTGAVFPINRYEYVVDRGESEAGVWADPVAGDIGIRDTRLADKEYWIEERGTASLLKSEIIDRSDDGGGFDFNTAGKLMQSGAVYVAYVITRLDLPGEDTPTSGGGGMNDFYILENSETFDPLTMGNKYLLSTFSTVVGTLTLGPLATMPDTRFRLLTHGGLQRNVIIQLALGDTCVFLGNAVNKITLGKGEEIEIVIKNNTLFVVERFTAHERLGQVVWSYKPLINGLEADGGLRALADYPRVLELLLTMPPNVVVGDSDWQTTTTIDGQPNIPINKGRWMYDGTNFRPPDLRDRMIKALTATDGSIYSGRYEHQKLLEHGHGLASNNDNGGSPYMSGAHSTGGNLGYDLNGSSGPINEYRSGPPINIATGASVSNADQKVNNIGLYPLIII